VAASYLCCGRLPLTRLGTVIRAPQDLQLVLIAEAPELRRPPHLGEPVFLLHYTSLQSGGAQVAHSHKKNKLSR
jgi:hypothetical protein